MLAPVILALSLTQGCPEPPSRSGPPPCAAQNVPGCLPGYIRDYDRYGRVVYRCDPNYAQAPAPQSNELPPVPGPSAPEAAPRYAQPYAPPPAYAPPAPYAPYGAPYARAHRGNVALVLMPGATTTRDRADHAEATGAVALELRGDTGGGRLRFGFESAPFGNIADVALKYDFNDRGEVRPFLAVAVGAADVDPDNGWHVTASGSAGIDFYPARNFFLTLELKQRAFTHRAVTRSSGIEQSGLPQTAFFVGVGLYL